MGREGGVTKKVLKLTMVMLSFHRKKPSFPN